MSDRGSCRSILLVDDDESMLALLELWLQGQEYRLLSATSVERAQLIISSEPIGVVVVDFELFDGTGLDVLTAARAANPTCAGVLLTGKASLDVAVRAINEGAVHRFLMKPCGEAAVRSAVASALEHHLELDVAAMRRKQTQKRLHQLEHLERRFPGIFDLPSEGGPHILNGARLSTLAAELDWAGLTTLRDMILPPKREAR